MSGRAGARSPSLVRLAKATALTVGLLLSLCLRLNVSGQDAAPGFLSKLAPLAPLAALAEAARANHIPLEQIDPSVEQASVLTFDTFQQRAALKANTTCG